MLKKIKNTNTGISYLDMIKIIWNKKFNIFLITLFFTLIGFNHALKQSNLYSASVDIKQSNPAPGVFDKYKQLNSIKSKVYAPTIDEEYSSLFDIIWCIKIRLSSTKTYYIFTSSL